MTNMALTLVDSENINQFLRNFEALTSLNMERSGLTSYLTAIGQMRRLSELSLAYNALTLDTINQMNWRN